MITDTIWPIAFGSGIGIVQLGVSITKFMNVIVPEHFSRVKLNVITPPANEMFTIGTTIDLIDLVKEYNIDFVPILYVGKLCDFLNGKTIQEASHGKSKLVDKLREGLVIRPYRDEFSQELDSRLILKHRSEEYLCVTEN